MMMNEDDETFARELLKNAGPRPLPPEEDLAAIESAARAVWQERYAKQHTAKWWALPLAAALAIAIGLAIWMSRAPETQAPTPAIVAASVEHVAGSLHLPDTLPAGFTVETPDETTRVALRLPNGQSVRIDGATRVVLVSPALLELQRGALYVDSTRLDNLVIRTKAGSFTPIGTQFEVRVDESTTRLRIREGRVAFDRENRRDVATAGEELSVDARGNIARAPLRADDPQWQWVIALAKLPAIEGQTLEWFLRFFARQQGWKLEYASPSASELASKTILHGTVEGMSLDDALRTVARSTGIEYHIESGVLSVKSERRRPGAPNVR